MARVLLVIPPFGGIDRPSLGIHTLQAVARSRGHLVDIYYSNMDFAARLGEVSYMIVTSFGVLKLFGERALGLKRGAIIPPALLEELNEQVEEAAALRGLKAEPVTMELLKAATTAWLNDAAMVVRSSAYDVIGFSTTFEQTNGVDLLAKLCRSLLPSVKLVAGGANCEGRMAEGMRRYIPELDTVFSGESEIAFADYLDDP